MQGRWWREQLLDQRPPVWLPWARVLGGLLLTGGAVAVTLSVFQTVWAVLGTLIVGAATLVLAAGADGRTVTVDGRHLSRTDLTTLGFLGFACCSLGVAIVLLVRDGQDLLRAVVWFGQAGLAVVHAVQFHDHPDLTDDHPERRTDA
jgi:hypothetical protein